MKKKMQHFLQNGALIISSMIFVIVLITHPTKAFVQPALQHIAGGSAYLRFVQCVIWLYSHEKDEKAKTSYVETSDGLHAEVQHDRSLCILKARNGRGTGFRIACSFTEDLKLKSHGVIVTKPEGNA